MSLLDEAVVLNNGNLMPKIGVVAEDANSLKTAVDAGYRLIDCPNAAKVDLSDLFKDSNRPQLYVEIQISEKINTREELRNSFATIRKNLVTSHADLCLLRMSDNQERNTEVWKEIEKIRAEGWIKTIGISNAAEDDLNNLVKNSRMKPSVIQMPYENQNLINVARQQRMQIEIPVKGDIAALAEIADNYNANPLELVLRYFNQKHIVPLIEASEITKEPETDFTIKPNDMATIGQMFASD